MNQWRLFALLALVPVLLLGVGLAGMFATSAFEEKEATVPTVPIAAAVERIESLCPSAAPSYRACTEQNQADTALIRALLRGSADYSQIILSLAFLSALVNILVWRSLTRRST